MRLILLLLRPLCLFSAVLLGGSVHAYGQTTVSIPPSKDNTLYENATGALSNAKEAHLSSGKTGIFGGALVRRPVLHFDVAGSGLIPDGATIESVELVLILNNATSGCVLPAPTTLHRLLEDWGEGTSNTGGVRVGQGALATPGDATWLHTFFDTQLWATPGGDFAASPSASRTVPCCPTAPFPEPPPVCAEAQSFSSEALRLDVLDWLASPAGNFGWLIRGDESVASSGRRFDSREGAHPPLLRVTFTGGASDRDLDGILDDGDGNGNVGSVPCSCQLFEAPSCKLDCDDNCTFTSNPTQLDRGALLAAPPDGIGDACQCGDVDDSGAVDEADVLLFRSSLLGPSSPLTTAGRAKCTVIGVAGECDILDVTVLRRTVEAPAGVGPGIAQVCASTEP